MKTISFIQKKSMSDLIQGLHHITAIAGDAQRNYDFYQKILGLRFVKKTVNFDDPGTYHFYYGDENGAPGTILTFFPWTHIRPGSIGTGMATEISYAIPGESLEFWKERLAANNIKHGEVKTMFGEQVLPFEDPDGLKLKFVVPSVPDNRRGWANSSVESKYAVKGFRGITLTLRDVKPTAAILTEIFGYSKLGQEGNIHRFKTNAVATADIVDIIEAPNGRPGIVAGGTNHHVAFRVKDEDVLMKFRDRIEGYGLNITPKIDRNYFYSLYFREPGGVLFEIATDNPGFAVDEPTAELGQHLKLPAQYESQRTRIESILPVLQQ